MRKMREKETKKMIVFGTIFESEMGGIKDILCLLGKKKEINEIDREYQRRKFFGPLGLKKLVKLFRGNLKDRLKKVALDYCQQKLLKGMREALAEFKKRGFLVGVLSSNPQFVMDVLKEILPLDFAIGTELEFKKGVATGRIKKEVNRYTKARILKMKRKKYGLSKENVIVIRRATITHLPMAREAGVFIGFDPTKDTIIDIAQTVVNK